MTDDNCCVGWGADASCTEVRAHEVFRANAAVHNSSLHSSSNLTCPVLALETPPLAFPKTTASGLNAVVDHTALTGTDFVGHVGEIVGGREANTTHGHAYLVYEGRGGGEGGEKLWVLSEGREERSDEQKVLNDMSKELKVFNRNICCCFAPAQPVSPHQTPTCSKLRGPGTGSGKRLGASAKLCLGGERTRLSA